MPEEPMVLAATRQADEIVSRVSGNKCTLIFGETGCGKSTQVPKILLARLFAGGRVLCTQPRRLAVVAVATRVADELGVEVNGPDVGYIIGLEQQSHATVSPSMLFVTSGYLLQKVKNEGAEALERYSCIILDEVHERSAENDLVLAIVRSLTPPQTKIVLMSATPNHRRLRDYFASSPSGARGGEEMQFVSLSQSASFFDIREKYLEDVKAKIASARGGGAAAASDRILENIGSGAAGVSNEEQQLDDVNALPLLQPVITELVVRLWPELGEDATVIVFLPTWNTLETQYSSLARRLPGITMHVLHSGGPQHRLESRTSSRAAARHLLLTRPRPAPDSHRPRRVHGGTRGGGRAGEAPRALLAHRRVVRHDPQRAARHRLLPHEPGLLEPDVQRVPLAHRVGLAVAGDAAPRPHRPHLPRHGLAARPRPYLPRLRDLRDLRAPHAVAAQGVPAAQLRAGPAAARRGRVPRVLPRCAEGRGRHRRPPEALPECDSVRACPPGPSSPCELLLTRPCAAVGGAQCA